MLEKLNDNTATERVWKIAKAIKRDYNLAFLAFSDSCSDSGSGNTFIRNDHFRGNLLYLFNQSGITPSTEIDDSVTEDALNAASEIFIYLSSCPKKINLWNLVFKELIMTQSLSRILLTLNRIRKSELTDTGKIKPKLVADKLFERILGDEKIMKRSSNSPNIESEFINHPVHVLSGNTKFSPSAFIPFCEFGQDMKQVSLEVDNFRAPFCNIFTRKIVHKQLCYEVDLEEIRNKTDSSIDLSSGLAFFIDLNEDREIKNKKGKWRTDGVYRSLVERMKKKDSHKEATIHLNTIGKPNNTSTFKDMRVPFRTYYTCWRRRIQPQCFKRNTSHSVFSWS